MEKTTIYVIVGGGQKIRENIHYSQPIKYQTVEDSDWPVLAKCHGVDTYAGDMWSTDLETLQRWANEWAGKKIKINAL